MQYLGKFFVFLCLTISISACNVPTIQETNRTQTTFFDLKGFFKEEAKYLKAQGVQIQKTIQHNQTKETQTILPKDWEKELLLFSDSDLNKPSWKDKYLLDSTDRGNGLTLLHYKAIDEKLSVQVLDVELKGTAVHSILIVKKIANQIYESQEHLTYIPRKSYHIKKSQEVTSFDKDDYTIEAKYIYHE
ncbi:MAG: Unknown protein [uncultured Aureispira sp.]|uniref:Lipoprotein n=1 Tax=uncultured Aureispira sp. TaxID=1331704 RepID=A0A6S6TNU6_9BACT|nr:MAG: Unknown protein [uncultured Aureispira sp.]